MSFYKDTKEFTKDAETIEQIMLLDYLTKEYHRDFALPLTKNKYGLGTPHKYQWVRDFIDGVIYTEPKVKVTDRFKDFVNTHGTEEQQKQIKSFEVYTDDYFENIGRVSLLTQYYYNDYIDQQKKQGTYIPPKLPPLKPRVEEAITQEQELAVKTKVAEEEEDLKPISKGEVALVKEPTKEVLNPLDPTVVATTTTPTITPTPTKPELVTKPEETTTTTTTVPPPPAVPTPPPAVPTPPTPATPPTSVPPADPTVPSPVPDPSSNQNVSQIIGTVPSTTPFAVDASPNEHKVRYYPNQILIYFGSIEQPDWDTELEENVFSDSFKMTKSEIENAIDNIIEAYPNQLFIIKRQSSSLEELHELLQLQFCILRNLHRGLRTKTASVPISSLVNFASKLMPQAQPAPATTTPPTTTPPTTTPPQPIQSDSVQVQLPTTRKEAIENIIKAYRDKKYEAFGKPVINESVKNDTKHVISYKLAKRPKF